MTDREADTPVSAIAHEAIPSILTTSCRTVLDHYREDIVHLEARGSTEGANQQLLDREYGVTVNQPGKTELEIVYEQRRDADGTPENPLTESAVEHLREVIDDTLQPVTDERTGRTYPPDLAVQELVVEVRDEQLQARTGETSPVFELTFRSDPAEDDLRERTRHLNEEKGLYRQGFGIRHLNLRQLVETRGRYDDRRHTPIIAWGGRQDINPKAPKTVASAVLNRHCPAEYGYLKVFCVDQHSELVLVDEQSAGPAGRDPQAATDPASATEGGPADE